MIRKRQYILVLGDIFACALSLTGMLLIRFGTTYKNQIVMDHISAFILIFGLWLVVFFIFNLYDIRMVNPNPRTIGRLGLAMCVAIVASVFTFYVHTSFGIAPRTNLAIVGILAFIGIVLWRRIFYRLFGSTFAQSIVLIGMRPEANTLAKEIHENKLVGKIVYHAKNVQDAIDFAAQKKSPVDLVIVEPEDPGSIALAARTFDTSVLTLVGAYEELFGKIPLSLLTDELARFITTKNARSGYTVVSRPLEIVVAVIVLVITSPVILIAAVAKKLEDGGQIILSPHNRVGKNGKIFHCYKIRSMIMDAEKSGVQWTQEEDPRITPVGKILRKLHIDELPQFWNILRGDMALVGPRPERPEFVAQLEKEIPAYYLRSHVTPGFTGWAQIKFRYARTVLDAGQKLEYDLYYAKNRTLLLDVGILLKTIQIIFTH